MKIVFVGAGNLATNLAKELFRKGNHIVQVFSRTMESAQLLASQVNAEAVTDIADVMAGADLYVLSVKDSALEGIVWKLCDGGRSGLFVHTAGSMPMDVFKGYAARYGVMYPMQTFSKNRAVDFREIPFFIEANTPEDAELLRSISLTMTEKVYELSSDRRKYLHLAAVFASNFTNHCYELCDEILSEHGIPFDVMLPLIGEIADKVRSMSPKEAQTGPALRYDANVIGKQEKLLAGNLRIRGIYNLMSDSIHAVAMGEE